ncbi:prephenate dehydratase [Hugonella massiliensis]|uniref:prephenate dehydratase n=1 Tax=Hugonella massiliensis TaxID=1720315 RepID=UPI00073F2F91|nr:prephenate dehydratase [Hugonella massiliensis]
MTEQISMAFLGPFGTNCDEAAQVFAGKIGQDVDFQPFDSFADVFEAVERGKADYGVVATENSLEGAVTSTLDNFAFHNSTTVIGETILDIHHCLVLHPGSHVADVKTVVSHPQGLAQCRRYIQTNLPGRRIVTASSTAESARMAASDPTVAGIAGEFAANLYGAEVHEREIGDRIGNQTSFALIGRTGARPLFQGDRYITSLALFPNDNRKGTLSMILSEFVYADIDLSMIQSRPTKQGLGSYMFFVNLEGKLEQPQVQTALNCLRLKLRQVKVLGSYPVA